jgi:hypothetical protein
MTFRGACRNVVPDYTILMLPPIKYATYTPPNHHIVLYKILHQ